MHQRRAFSYMRNDSYLSLFTAGRTRLKSRDKSDYFIHRRTTTQAHSMQPRNGLKCPAGKLKEDNKRWAHFISRIGLQRKSTAGKSKRRGLLSEHMFRQSLSQQNSTKSSTETLRTFKNTTSLVCVCVWVNTYIKRLWGQIHQKADEKTLRTFRCQFIKIWMIFDHLKSVIGNVIQQKPPFGDTEDI